MRPLKLFATCALLLTTMSLASAQALACDCKIADAAAAEEASAAIFYGEVEAYEEVKPDQWQASFKVLTPYKGKLKANAIRGMIIANKERPELVEQCLQNSVKLCVVNSGCVIDVLE